MAPCSTELTPAAEASDIARRHVQAVLDGRGCSVDTVLAAQRLVVELLGILPPTSLPPSLTVRVDGMDLLFEVEEDERTEPVVVSDDGRRLDAGPPRAEPLARGWEVSPFLDSQQRPGRIVWLLMPRSQPGLAALPAA
jgi:hypothetical protein